MAAVIRVKRRRNEDPVEALLLSQKKSRLDPAIAVASDVKEDTVLEFAGTISSKDEPVSTHIKEAIRRKKLHRELHPHSAESRPTSEFMSKVRRQTAQASQTNRYQIICAKRAINIDSLDCVNTSDETGEKSFHFNDAAGAKERSKKQVDGDNSTTSNASSSSSVSPLPGAEADGGHAHIQQASNSGDLPETSDETSEKVCCLLDVEHHERQTEQASASGITMNNVPMVSRKPAPIEEESDDYVYDLYYTHMRLSEQEHLEAFLSVEGMCNEVLYPEHRHSDEEEIGDLDEDSNDEADWRNDYPEEDPGFYENEGQDYDYENDMVENNFANSDDEGDLLSYWIDTRCRIEVDCSDFGNNENGNTDESSSDEYKEDINILE